MAFQPADAHTFALSVRNALSTSPPFLLAADEGLGEQPAALGLLSQLLSPTFLNGTDDANSVWAALDALVPPSTVPSTTSATKDSTATLLSFPFFGHSGAKEEKADLAVLDDGSICVSVPLSPSPSADEIQGVPYTVEHTEVEVDEQGAVSPSSSFASSSSSQGARRNSDDGGRWWSLGWGAKETPKGERKLRKVQKAVLAKKIFTPPTDRLSVRCTWWGYELYLPEAIFSKLVSDVGPVASALASLAAGLTLLSTNLPSFLLSLPGGPLLASLLPLVSTVVASLSWYWKTIQSRDKGEGVVLAATWVLPMAVVPRTLRLAKTAVEEKEGGVELKELGGKKDTAGAIVEEKSGPVDETRKQRRTSGLKRVLSLTRR
ncbi:hypothetical protein JCM8097_004647 [Rhodosporidiobolus ruineniae]